MFMKTYIFDSKKIELLISDFYISTGIAITIYDINTNVVASSGNYTPFCSLIRSNPEYIKRCKKSNLVHINKAKEKRETVYYTCHAGNMEVITPIIFEGTIIAYLQIGQFHDENGTYANIQKLNCFSDLNNKLLFSLYSNIPVVSDKKLSALQNILQLIIKSFWVDGLISYKRSMLSVKIEQYIFENLDQKIYVGDICKKFSLSRNALYDLFNKEFGMAVNEFILKKRIELAKSLLANKNKSISEISDMCGFTDYNYFIRIFKKQCGTTPLKYRKMTAL